MITTTQLKHYNKSGARIYIKQELLNEPTFPFKQDEILKITIQKDQLIIEKPEWWEMIDWNQMPQAWITLPQEIKQKITQAGQAPETN